MPCPVCLAEEKTLLFNVPGATISQCAHCSHTFSHDFDTPHVEVYNDSYFQEQHKNWFENPNYELFKKIAATCEKTFGNKNISVLDVGCGNGDFLRYLSGQGFTNLTGVDFSSNQDDKINFVQKNIFEVSADTFGQKFDCVASLATIEHVEDVHKFMNILSSLVKPGGVVCIMTLDDDSIIYRASRWLGKLGIKHGINRVYDRHHINHFSKRSLKKLVDDTNKFAVIEHYNINFPVKAIDLSKSIFNMVLRPLIMATFFVTNQINRMQFLQVITIKSAT